MTDNQPITAAELAELRRLDDLGGKATGADITEMQDALPRLLDEIERLRAVIRRTHTTHCTDWPTHSPWCLLYEVEP